MQDEEAAVKTLDQAARKAADTFSELLEETIAKNMVVDPIVHINRHGWVGDRIWDSLIHRSGRVTDVCMGWGQSRYIFWVAEGTI
jgi:hypothetical protein